MIKLPQPFKITDIQKYPRAVVIALLIGFLLIFSTVIGHLYNRKEVIADKCEAEKQRLYEVIITERNERIRLYESLIFYKNEANSYKRQSDSMMQQTKPLVSKILAGKPIK